MARASKKAERLALVEKIATFNTVGLKPFEREEQAMDEVEFRRNSNSLAQQVIFPPMQHLSLGFEGLGYN